jgi:hypothetical protein
MRLLSIALVGVLGCSAATSSARMPMRSPRVPVCGLESPNLATQLMTGLAATVLLGGVVAIGYTAIGGDAPLR